MNANKGTLQVGKLGNVYMLLNVRISNNKQLEMWQRNSKSMEGTTKVERSREHVELFYSWTKARPESYFKLLFC